MYSNIPIKPFAPTDQDQQRWEHSSLRKRLIIGAWENDLEDELSRHLPADRREAWGPADLSSNPFEQITRQLSVLYHEVPSITNLNGDISDLTAREGLVTKAGLWQLMQRAQQMVIGLRETAIRIDVNPHTVGGSTLAEGIQYRIVTPDLLYCEAHPDQPDIPVYYQEARLRVDEKGKNRWVADVLDIRNPNNPIFGMYVINQDGSLGEDVSEMYMGHPTHRGEDYPYQDSNGVPFLPVVLYHAEKTGFLWDSYNASQMVYGSLTSAVLYSMWVHLVRDACWSQKYVAGLSVAGLSQMDQNEIARRSSIATDPSSILVFTQDPDAQGQPLVGSFSIPTDPHALLESISKYEMRVGLAAGLSPSDISRQSGDPRSGYSLAISKSGQREAQKKFAPIFRLGDEELLSKTAILANRFLGTSLPEDGYRISYHSLPLTSDEMRAQREDIVGKMQAGLISPVQAVMMMYPDMDDREAREYLLQIRRERAEFL
tara:strand:+ start:194 stop:1654 length:1461 start_codon:yes stop_codon:yes gene_type:complete